MKERILLSYAKGITHSPSDLLCEDGELEECVNLEVKNGELVPTEMPVKLGFSMDDGEVLVLVHNTKTEEKRYVTLTDGVLKIFQLIDSVKDYYGLTLDCGTVNSIQAVGNTIVVYSASTPHYILYSEGDYKYLGSEFPDVSIAFDLNGEFVVGDEFEFSTPEGDMDDEDFQSEVCSELIPEVNKFIAEEATAEGKFMYPFFVRYALRMFDGTYTMQSAPILMLPSTNISPFVVSYSDMRNYSNKTFKAQVGAFVASLEAKITAITGAFSDWTDIITSVDVFLSRQITTYDQNGTEFGDATLGTSKFIGKFGDVQLSTLWDGYSQMAGHTTLEAGDNEYLHRWYIPAHDEEEIKTELTNTSLFYHFFTLNISDLVLNSTIELTGKLDSLEVQETLKDDYMTHDVLLADNAFVYNGRLNITGVQRKMFKGFPVQCMTQIVQFSPQDGFDIGLYFGIYEVYTFLRNGIVVKSDTSTLGSMYGSFLFYPDTDAYQMIIHDSINNRWGLFELKEHPLLNGSYYFGGFNVLPFAFRDLSASAVTTDGVEYYSNKLFVSEVNNPFHFPLEGIYTVGSDRIIGIGAVTRPISQGQFGEFPLIAFCSDGNYALRVDNEGYYTSISPVQEDVVLDKDKIISMENSLAVITQRGVMLTVGGEISKIASQMDGGILYINNLAGIKTSVTEFSDIVNLVSDDTGFLSYIRDARMAYDYASNRLLIYHPLKSYSYIYHFDNNTVSKLYLNGGSCIITSVNDYPDMILQDETGALYSLYEKEDVNALTEHQYGFALTRPLKMGKALTLKSVKQVFMMASIGDPDSYVKYILYGSNDGLVYNRIMSRFGKPYKFYRLAIYSHLLAKESVAGAMMTIEERRANKLRQ